MDPWMTHRIFRWPFVLASVGGLVLLVMGGAGLSTAVRFACNGVSVGGRIIYFGAKFPKSVDLGTSSRAMVYATYQYEDERGQVHQGTEWLMAARWRVGDDVVVQYLRDSPDTSRLGADEVFAWIMPGLLVVLGALVLRIPWRRPSRPAGHDGQETGSRR
jgi:hypothetical protein